MKAPPQAVYIREATPHRGERVPVDIVCEIVIARKRFTVVRDAQGRVFRTESRNVKRGPVSGDGPKGAA